MKDELADANAQFFDKWYNKEGALTMSKFSTLFNYYDAVNIMAHETKHIEMTSKGLASSGIAEVEVYLYQMEHSSWDKTSSQHKYKEKGKFLDYLNSATNFPDYYSPDKIKTFKDKYNKANNTTIEFDSKVNGYVDPNR